MYHYTTCTKKATDAAINVPLSLCNIPVLPNSYYRLIMVPSDEDREPIQKALNHRQKSLREIPINWIEAQEPVTFLTIEKAPRRPDKANGEQPTYKRGHE